MVKKKRGEEEYLVVITRLKPPLFFKINNQISKMNHKKGIERLNKENDRGMVTDIMVAIFTIAALSVTGYVAWHFIIKFW